MKYFFYIIITFFLISCQKETGPFDGNYSGNLYWTTFSTTIDLTSAEPDTTYNTRIDTLDMTLEIQGSCFDASLTEGSIEYDNTSISFSIEKDFCPPEADCFYPLHHGPMTYLLNGDNLLMDQSGEPYIRTDSPEFKRILKLDFHYDLLR